jgi:hypothetical protein
VTVIWKLIELTPKIPQTPIRVSAPLRGWSKREAVAVGGVPFHFQSKPVDYSPRDL